MKNDKTAVQLPENTELEDLFLDYDDILGIFIEACDSCSAVSEEEKAEYLPFCRTTKDDPECGSRVTSINQAEQQILFCQVFEILTEDYVDPISGLFHFKRPRENLVN